MLIHVKQVTSFTDRQHTTGRQEHLPAHLLAINTKTDCVSFSDTDTRCPARSESLGPPADPPTTKTVTPPLFQQLYELIQIALESCSTPMTQAVVPFHGPLTVEGKTPANVFSTSRYFIKFIQRRSVGGSRTRNCNRYGNTGSCLISRH